MLATEGSWGRSLKDLETPLSGLLLSFPKPKVCFYILIINIICYICYIVPLKIIIIYRSYFLLISRPFIVVIKHQSLKFIVGYLIIFTMIRSISHCGFCSMKVPKMCTISWEIHLCLNLAPSSICQVPFCFKEQ